MIEVWVLYGLAAAATNGLFNTYQKILTSNGRDPVQILLIMHLIAFILLSPTLFIYPPAVTTELLGLLLLTGILNGLSFWYLAVAYESGALSIVAPLRGITPILVALVEPLVFPDFQYKYALIFASVLVGLGLYVLLYEDSVLKPIQRVRNKGVRKGIMSSAIISVAVIVDRYALVNTSVEPESYATLVIFSALVASFIITWKISDIKEAVTFDREILPIGILRALSIFLAFGALSLAEGTRVNIILQLGIIIATVAGGGILKENNIIRRVIGALFIVASAVLVALL